MKKLIMCTGLPGSGKSFWAETQRHITRSIVNKDDIRKELEITGWTWSHENEKDVVKIRDERVVDYLNKLSDGGVVISTDCNFGKHEKRLRQLAAENGAEFEIKSFLDVPIETCIERDSKREGKAKVGEAVIRGMAKANLIGPTYIDNPILEVRPEIRPYKPDITKRSAIICDLDGTLSLDDGKRGPYEHEKCDKDKVNEPVKTILEVFHRFMAYDVIYLSGREDKFRGQTDMFRLINHCPPGNLWMRNTGDRRKDWIVKSELFDAHIRDNYFVRFVLDDRNQVVKFWRSIGLTCLQVADGAF